MFTHIAAHAAGGHKMANEDINSNYTDDHCYTVLCSPYMFQFMNTYFSENHWMCLSTVGSFELFGLDGKGRCDTWYRVNGFHILRLICMNAIIHNARICLIHYDKSPYKFIANPFHTDNNFIQPCCCANVHGFESSVQHRSGHIFSFIQLSAHCHQCCAHIFFFLVLKITLWP